MTDMSTTTTYITSLVPGHWGDHPITAGTVAVLTAYARQGVSRATLAALAEGIEVAVDVNAVVGGLLRRRTRSTTREAWTSRWHVEDC